MEVRILPVPPNKRLKSERSTIISYKSVAQEYREKGWAPVPVLGKTPVPAGATGREGTVTDEKISAWIDDPKWGDANIALRAEGWIGLDVDVYGDKRGDLTLKALEDKLGLLPATITSTAREPFLADGTENPSRQHLFRVPEGMRFQTGFKDLEIIQHSHRYTVVASSIHPITGMSYAWYDYDGSELDEIPDLDMLEDLPEAWIAYLQIPESDFPERSGLDGFEGTVKEWLEGCEDGAPGTVMTMWIDSIPKRDFGHNEMIDMQAQLVSYGAHGEPGVPQALSALQGAWLRGEYDTPEYRQDFQTSLSGAIRKFGDFKPRPSDILKVDQVAVATRIQDPDFLDAWISLPDVVTPESLVERMSRVMSIALSEGATLAEAAALAWHSPTRKHGLSPLNDYPDQTSALRALFGLARDMEIAPVLEERRFVAEPEPVVEVEPLAPERKVKLLTVDEEAALQQVTWWGDGREEGHFMAVMQEANPVMSEQYYRLNRWIILSLIFANKAVLKKKNGTPIPLVIYGGVTGPSATGKSESLQPVIQIPSLFNMKTDDPDIGGDATAEGLTRALLARDNKTSFFHSDEADHVLTKWSDEKSGFGGMKQKITDFYGGRVPPIQRSTKADESGKAATCYLCVHLMGVDEKIAGAISPSDWESGFINRFVWAKGERKALTEEQMRFETLSAGEEIQGGTLTKWYQQWVASFQRTSTILFPTSPIDGLLDNEPALIEVEPDVTDRHTQTILALAKLASESNYPERLRPTFTRLEVTILKCAALVAIVSRRRHIQMSDYLIALEQAEEWTENILDLVRQTDLPIRAREADKIAKIIERSGGTMKTEEIHRQMPGNETYVNGLLRELEAQGRTELLPVADSAGKVTSKTKGIVRMITEGM